MIPINRCNTGYTYNSSTKLCEKTLEEDAVIYACTPPSELKEGKCYAESNGNRRCKDGTYTQEFGGGCYKSPGITPDYPIQCPSGYARIVGGADRRRCHKIVNVAGGDSETRKRNCQNAGYEYKYVGGNDGSYFFACINLAVSTPIVPCKAPVSGEIWTSECCRGWDKCFYARFNSSPGIYNCVNGTVQFGDSCYQQMTGSTWEKFICAKPGYILSGRKCTKTVTHQPFF